MAATLSPLSSPGKHEELRSVELSSRSSSVQQGAEMYRAKTQAREARIMAQLYRTRIQAVHKKELETLKAVQKIALEEEFHLRMLSEKAERERAKRMWKEEQYQRTQEAKSKLQAERANAERRRKEAAEAVAQRKKYLVGEERHTRTMRDATVRRVKDQERAAKRLLKQSVLESERQAQTRYHSSKASSALFIQEAYSQQVEQQRKLRLEAIQEAELLKQKAKEAMDNFQGLTLEKTQEKSRRRTVSPQLVSVSGAADP